MIGRDGHAAREAIFLTAYAAETALIHVGAPEDLPAEDRAAFIDVRDAASGGQRNGQFSGDAANRFEKGGTVVA